MTHSQILKELPRPETIEDSDCPGELRVVGWLYPPRPVELWVCRTCNYTFVVRIHDDGEKDIHNAFPAPVIPELKLHAE